MNLKEVLLSKIFKLVYLFIFMEISVIHANYIRFASNPKESNWENEYPEHDYLQEENGEHIYGSGKYDDYIDSFDEGGKYDDFEGSTDSSGNFKENNRNSNTYMGVPNHESRCLQMLHQAEKDDIPGSFMPRCTFDGYFTALQCHGSKGECWCSTKNGRQIPGTLTTDALSTCDKYDLETGKEKLPFDKKGKDLKKHKKMKAEDENIILKRIETKNQQENKEFFIPYDNLSNNRKKTSKESVKKLNESASSHQQSEDFFVFSSLRFHSLLSQPGLLAAIVSLLLVFVLCISSVVVLSVCRLKQRSHKEETKSHLEAESVINGYNSHLTYPHRLDNTAEIYAGGGFSYTPGISPAKCQTMNLRMSPWAHGNGYLTNKSSHLMYSKCADQEMFA